MDDQAQRTAAEAATLNWSLVVAACLTYPQQPTPRQIEVVRAVFERASPESVEQLYLQALQIEITAAFPRGDTLALVYGGATKIKEYVFESPRLPEIRGASALLDWVNTEQPPRIWQNMLHEWPAGKAEDCLIYKSGGSILGFAPKGYGVALAEAIERTYTEQTLTAKSAAVSRQVALLELRYGRLFRRDEHDNINGRGIAYWVAEFERDWQDEALQKVLAPYYYLGEHTSVRERFLGRKNFGELITLLATAYNRRRDEQQAEGASFPVAFSPLLPWAVKCESSDMRGAVVEAQVGDEKRRLSEASARKRVVGQQVKREGSVDWFTNTFTWSLPTSKPSGKAAATNDLIPRLDSWETRWNAYLEKHPDTHYAQHAKRPGNEHIQPARDIAPIGAASQNYIGVIYADGNNVGRLIASLQTPATYAAVSKVLSEETQDAVFAALAAHLEPHGDHHPFEILAIGGDDLFVIVPGNVACEIAQHIAHSFEQRVTSRISHIPGVRLPNAMPFAGRYSGPSSTDEKKPILPQLGLSAGIVIAPSQTPIFFLQDLVEQLLKSAKAKAKEQAAAQFFGGAVDFMVLKSISMVTDKVKEFRERALRDGKDVAPKGTRTHLTARPYTWAEFHGLLDVVRTIKRVGSLPRSQLYRIREVMVNQEVALVSSLEYAYTLSRQPGQVQKDVNSQLGRWKRADASSILGPWMRRAASEQYETIWLDMIELYDMIKILPKEA